MNIAIVGARERDTEEDRELVGKLMEQIAVEAPRSTFVAALTHIGVGRFVKDKCLEKDDQNNYRFALIECQTRIYSRSMSKSDLAQVYLARNATPFEISDFLIYLASEDRRGTMEDLLDRFLAAHRPVLLLKPGDALPDRIIGLEKETHVI